MARLKGGLLLLCLTISAVRAAPKFLPDAKWKVFASNPAYASFSAVDVPSSNVLQAFPGVYPLNSELPNYGIPPSVYDAPTKKMGKSRKTSKVFDDNLLYRKRRSTDKPITDMATDELPEHKGSVDTPKEQLSIMYDMAKANPIMDLPAQKQAFPDALFNNIVSPTSAGTVPQNTIVPPSFWIPTSISIDPVEYNKRVNDFLKKLFDKMKINLMPVTTASTTGTGANVNEMQARIARSTEDMSSLVAAKDNIVESILTDLGIIKNDMVSTVDDLITYGKTATTVSPLFPGKPLKPFMSPMWMKPTADPMLPFKQRIMILNKMFDMLTDLQRNITANIVREIKANANAAETLEITGENNLSPNFPSDMWPQGEAALNLNMTLLDAIKKKLSDIKITNPSAYLPADINQQMSTMEAEQQGTLLPGGFKREVPSDSLIASINPGKESDLDEIRHQYTRAVSMKMHQGYQSLPAGASESVQAGGGSMLGHQGGGIKVLDTDDYGDLVQWTDWMEYLENERQKHRHHHNHH